MPANGPVEIAGSAKADVSAVSGAFIGVVAEAAIT
jgi:hypothetical protein